MVASLSTSSVSSSPVTHFFSFDFPATAPYNLTDYSSSSALFHICSLAGNHEQLMSLNSPSAAALSTAIHLNTAVLGLSQLSEVYVYAISDQSSDPSASLWTSVGILKASDSFLGDLFGTIPTSSSGLTLFAFRLLCLRILGNHSRGCTSSALCQYNSC